jgi:DNA-binding PadR family transcriptional regulator
MAAGAMDFRYFVLGLLDRHPMSGYDIKRFFKRLNWLFGSSSFGNIYPTLHTLLENDLVTVDVISRPDRPAKKVYSINEKGRQTLRAWIKQPESATSASLKAFAMRLLFANHLSSKGLIAHLRGRRAEVAAHCAILNSMIGESHKTNVRNRLAFDYGLAMANAEMNWIDSALDQLQREPLLKEAVENARVTDAG